jgi:multidrug efflux system outer membrane protein
VDSTAQLPDPWWTIFQDETLDKLVEEALAHNPDVTIAAGRVAEARAGLRITNADRLPNLQLQGDATRSKDSALVNTFPGVRLEQTTYTVQGAVGYELDLWGKYQRASESARAALLNTEYGREATKLSLTGDVVRGYFGLIASAEQLASARDTLKNREDSLRLEKLRFDAGESDEFTYKRAEADTASTRIALHQFELDLVTRTNALGILLGRSPKDLVDAAISVQGASLPAAVTLPAACRHP